MGCAVTAWRCTSRPTTRSAVLGPARTLSTSALTVKAHCGLLCDAPAFWCASRANAATPTPPITASFITGMPNTPSSLRRETADSFLGGTSQQYRRTGRRRTTRPGIHPAGAPYRASPSRNVTPETSQQGLKEIREPHVAVAVGVIRLGHRVGQAVEPLHLVAHGVPGER